MVDGGALGQIRMVIWLGKIKMGGFFEKVLTKKEKRSIIRGIECSSWGRAAW